MLVHIGVLHTTVIPIAASKSPRSCLWSRQALTLELGTSFLAVQDYPELYFFFFFGNRGF